MLPEINASFLKNLVSKIKTPGPPEEASYEATAVFLLIFEKNNTPFILAVLKADNIGYPWRNQVALPGGHIDKEDKDSLEAAYRELEEEVGISRNQVEYIGAIGHFQTIAQKDIEVFVGIWNTDTDNLRYDSREIAKILELPLINLLHIHLSSHFHRHEPNITKLIYPIQDVVIWGVTARIFHNFFELILNNMKCPSDIFQDSQKKECGVK